MKEMIRFIGLDVHKEFISVAIAEEGRGEVESYDNNGVYHWILHGSGVHSFLLKY